MTFKGMAHIFNAPENIKILIMRKIYMSLILTCLAALTLTAQEGVKFDAKIDVDFTNIDSIQTTTSPVQTQVLFVAEVDSSLTLNRFLEPNGKSLVKDGHDFVGITQVTDDEYLISINHEKRSKSYPKTGFGGGMTVFKIKRNVDGTFDYVEQDLADGRNGVFFNVDFDNTVGETWTNCGGIISPNGEIWTAEEYPSGGNSSIMSFLPDTGDVVIDMGVIQPFNNDAAQLFAGDTIKRVENQGWMVQIDPVTSKAVRKQYNWGRMSFEGGCIMPDNKTVYLTDDYRGALFTKFVADEAGDFTSGSLYVFKTGAGEGNGNWVEMDNTDLDEMINLREKAYAKGIDFFLRLEWITEVNGKVYIAETGYDSPCKKSEWKAALDGGATPAAHHEARATAQGTTTGADSDYHDYYGRILCYDPATDEVTVYLEGGGTHAHDLEQSQAIADYPTKHLSNPDGLGKVSFGGKDWLVINEDLNGSTFNRVPAEAMEAGNKLCEMYLLDASIEAPAISDLVRIAVGPKGAELTGGNGTQDGKSILVDVQHPKDYNTFPDNNANTKALTGWDRAIRTFNNDAEQLFDGQTIKRVENQGWMVQIDPVTSKAVRKQYNWGRMSFEGGCIMPDNKTVYLTDDYRGALFTKFVADEAGDFTSGSLYVFKTGAGEGNGNWVEMDNTDLDEMINLREKAYAKGIDFFLRLEWITEVNGKVYIAETGYDSPCKKSEWKAALDGGATPAAHHEARATAQGTTTGADSDYHDYYGRILCYDPATDEVTVYLEGGGTHAHDLEQSQAIADYPTKHLSNPDGLGKVSFGGKDWLVINEDLNGSTFNRVPAEAMEAGNKLCEMYLLDASIEAPAISDLVRIAVGPKGAELTGGNGTQDGKSILVDVQHPKDYNTFPDNNANTKALTGWDRAIRTFNNDAEQLFDGQTIKRVENQGWMVQIDPVTSKAVRKQYNWGRMSFEGGCIMPDNKTVYLTDDYRGALFTKFVADEAGDFTSGSLYVFKTGAGEGNGNWVEMDNTDLDEMINLREKAYAKGIDFFLRLEWITEVNGKVYIAETGYDSPCKKSEWKAALDGGATPAAHHEARATAQGTTTGADSDYHDYYGRILCYDPATDEVTVYLEGGGTHAHDLEQSQAIADYPTKHLSNPDGLGKVSFGGKHWLVINEDLNGSTFNRVPAEAMEAGNKLCEMYLLDASIEAPEISDLVRIAVGPKGAELTGGNGTQDGKSILVDVQHPKDYNTFPDNNANTKALTGWDKLANVTDAQIDIDWTNTASFQTAGGGIITQTLFIGGVDEAHYLDVDGNPAGKAAVKQGHDFIGITPTDDDGYIISVNHETRTTESPNLGYGGGMTSFKVVRDATNDSLIVVERTLADGRVGKFMNVEFDNVVGETWTNCGGIIGPDGSIWTAEEYPSGGNSSIASFVPDTADVTIGVGIDAMSEIEIDIDWTNTASFQTAGGGIITQTLFIGGVDEAHYLDVDGNPAGKAAVKQGHDFIGITPTDDDGYIISVNHETRTTESPNLGYGGGMTSFKVVRDAATDSLVIMDRTLADGRVGKFMNVEFDNVVGETWTNCGGIIGPDGSIWTAEEYPSGGNSSIASFVPDTADVTIGVGIDAMSEIEIDIDWTNTASFQTAGGGIITQTLFIGGVDEAHYLDAYGKPAGKAAVKQGHDFIGITPTDDDGYIISVNHETRTTESPELGYGGGMTSFKVVRDAATDSLVIKERTLADGRVGKFMNVEFDNVVGETWTNCGGIIGPDGSIWTAEEYPSGGNSSIASFVPDTGRVIIGEGKIRPFINENEQLFAGERIQRVENQGWMVQIDPATGKAIRKQYNWGRMSFEGGCIMPDNKTVYLTDDYRGALFTKFVADEAGDFTKGSLYVFKTAADEGNGNWVKMNNDDIDEMINLRSRAYAKGINFFLRLEWITEVDGKVYICETGYDSPCKKSEWKAALNGGATPAAHHVTRATDQGTTTDADSDYHDYYGRILCYDPATDEVTVYLEGGPVYDQEQSQAIADYPATHLTNPDGLGKITVNGKNYLLICEDINGKTFNRVPAELLTDNSTLCELYMLDMTIEDPTIDDLVRIMVGPKGAELTGANGTQDGKSIIVNIQHPSSSNKEPFNHATTVALSGWNEIRTDIVDFFKEKSLFMIYPNPAQNDLYFNGVYDIAIYDINGSLIKTEYETSHTSISDLSQGTYFVKNGKGDVKKLVVN